MMEGKGGIYVICVVLFRFEKCKRLDKHELTLIVELVQCSDRQNSTTFVKRFVHLISSAHLNLDLYSIDFSPTGLSVYLLLKYFNTHDRLLFLASLNICYLQIYNLNLTFDYSIKYNMEIDVKYVILYVDVHVKQHI